MSNKHLSQWLSQSHAGRILLLGLLILLLQIPVSSVESLVSERQATQSQAALEVQQKWGQEQQLIGPLLVIPYQHKRHWQDAFSGVKETKIDIKHAVFLPETFAAQSRLSTEKRYRGIFEVPLYQAAVTMSGHFAKPQFSQWDIQDEDVLWDRAKLVIMVSDARAIQKQATLNWNGTGYVFEPGTAKTTLNKAGYHAQLKNLHSATQRFAYSIELLLNGSNSVYLAPVGKDSELTFTAPWPDPSFQGKWLPTSRQVSADGFDARWRIPYLGRNFPQQTRDYPSVHDEVSNSLVGVDLITPIDNYRMAERSIKYALLFLFLTFGAIWLMEVMAGMRVHVIQYLLIGAGLCLFYLLELSLSEHLGFYWAYAIATAAIVTMISAYAYVVLHSGKHAVFIGASLSALYLYLFTLLQEQNYALLIGAVSLFALLAVVMYVTRNIDWFRLKPPQAPQYESAEQA